MITRRAFMALSGVAAAVPSVAAGSAAPAGKDDYEGAVRRIWRHAEGDPADAPSLLRELVRYATLAPSSHNTQCWKFRLGERSIAILPDLARRCPVVDPDDHHLFVSLGCAAENLAQAALANGLKALATPGAGAPAGLHVALEPTRAVRSALFDAIPLRQSTRAEYDGKPLTGEELQRLERAGSGAGVRVLLLTGKEAMDAVLEYVIAANTAQIDNPAFVEELKRWIRFGESEAVRSGDGLFSRSTGNPALPRWLGSILFGLVFTPGNENDKLARQLRSSSGIAVFVSDADDPTQWMETGRAFQRFALQAAALGIRNAHVNQPVEVSTVRPQLATFLGIGPRRPDLVVRFGRGPLMPRSLRRPIRDVLA